MGGRREAGGSRSLEPGAGSLEPGAGGLEPGAGRRWNRWEVGSGADSQGTQDSQDTQDSQGTQDTQGTRDSQGTRDTQGGGRGGEVSRGQARGVAVAGRERREVQRNVLHKENGAHCSVAPAVF